LSVTPKSIIVNFCSIMCQPLATALLNPVSAAPNEGISYSVLNPALDGTTVHCRFTPILSLPVNHLKALTHNASLCSTLCSTLRPKLHAMLQMTDTWWNSCALCYRRRSRFYFCNSCMQCCMQQFQGWTHGATFNLRTMLRAMLHHVSGPLYTWMERDLQSNLPGWPPLVSDHFPSFLGWQFEFFYCF